MVNFLNKYFNSYINVQKDGKEFIIDDFKWLETTKLSNNLRKVKMISEKL